MPFGCEEAFKEGRCIQGGKFFKKWTTRQTDILRALLYDALKWSFYKVNRANGWILFLLRKDFSGDGGCSACLKMMEDILEIN